MLQRRQLAGEFSTNFEIFAGRKRESVANAGWTTAPSAMARLPFLDNDILFHVARHLDSGTLASLARAGRRLESVVEQAARSAVEAQTAQVRGWASGVQRVWKGGRFTSSWLSSLNEIEKLKARVVFPSCGPRFGPLIFDGGRRVLGRGKQNTVVCGEHVMRSGRHFVTFVPRGAMTLQLGVVGDTFTGDEASDSSCWMLCVQQPEYMDTGGSGGLVQWTHEVFDIDGGDRVVSESSSPRC